MTGIVIVIVIVTVIEIEIETETETETEIEIGTSQLSLCFLYDVTCRSFLMVDVMTVHVRPVMIGERVNVEVIVMLTESGVPRMEMTPTNPRNYLLLRNRQWNKSVRQLRRRRWVCERSRLARTKVCGIRQSVRV